MYQCVPSIMIHHIFIVNRLKNDIVTFFVQIDIVVRLKDVITNFHN